MILSDANAQQLESGDPQLPPVPVTEGSADDALHHDAGADRPYSKSGWLIRPAAAALVLLVTLASGLAGGYLLATHGQVDAATGQANTAPANATSVSPNNQVALPDAYTLPVALGNLGPQLLTAGAIDYDRFVQLYRQTGRPLAEDQLAALTKGSTVPIVINRQNAQFLLNFFWALGLTNHNPILTDGPLMQYGKGKIGGFASTGGWTLGAKPATDLYASAQIIPLTAEQQARLEEVAAAVYRPCCNNPTLFPDCNHGMAMLGLLELMAAQNASVPDMFTAAKYVNAFWFPQETMEQAVFFKASQNLEFAAIDARQLVGKNFSSGSGFQSVHQQLQANGLLPQTPNSGNSCGVG